MDLIGVTTNPRKALHRLAIVDYSADFPGGELRLYLYDEINSLCYEEVRYGSPGKKGLVFIADS